NWLPIRVFKVAPFWMYTAFAAVRFSRLPPIPPVIPNVSDVVGPAIETLCPPPFVLLTLSVVATGLPGAPLSAILPAETLRSWIGVGGKKPNETVYGALARLNVAESFRPGEPAKFQLPAPSQLPPKGFVQMYPLAWAAAAADASMSDKTTREML